MSRPPEPWRIISSQSTYRDRWISLRSDRCETASGRIIEPFHVLEYPDWVNVLALTPAGEAVIVTEYRHGAGRVLPGLPSGCMEPSDRDAEQAARRELLEETGYAAENFVRLGEVYPNPANQTNRTLFFLALSARRVQSPKPDENEELAVSLMPLEQLVTRALEGELPLNAQHGAALFFVLGLILRGEDPRLAGLRERLAGLLLG